MGKRTSGGGRRTASARVAGKHTTGGKRKSAGSGAVWHEPLSLDIRV